MEFYQTAEPKISKPIVIAALQDMGNVGSIVIDFINDHLNTKEFRVAKSSFPNYVVDKGGHVELPEERWSYNYTTGLIVFGGGTGQPQNNTELHELCQDVVDISKKYSAKFLFALGGFHTDRRLEKDPNTFVTATSPQLASKLEKSGFHLTPQQSLITGFNGLILGYAKSNGIQGIGLFGEINEPAIPQYRTAKNIIKTLEKLTFYKFGDTAELDTLANEIDEKLEDHWSPKFKQ